MTETNTRPEDPKQLRELVSDEIPAVEIDKSRILKTLRIGFHIGGYPGDRDTLHFPGNVRVADGCLKADHIAAHAADDAVYVRAPYGAHVSVDEIEPEVG